MERVKVMLSQSKHKSKALFMVDTLKKLDIDHYFKEEISVISDISYIDMHKFCKGGDGNLTDIAQQFKLLREAGHDVSSDVFQRFMDEKGQFMPSLSNNLNGLINLHEASFLNMGEEILYKANEFSTIHLKLYSKDLEPNDGSLVRHTLEHPYRLSLKQYKAKNFLKLLLLRNNAFISMKELAQIELQTNQRLYQDEFKNISRWWKDLGLAKELTFARDQILKWYLWPMTVLPGPQFSKHRLEITKAISLVYLMDDIFDVMGTAEELAQFTEAINRWEDSSSLPGYMRVCFNALKEVTSDIVRFVEQEYGWNPTCFIRRSWAKLCKAFLVESKWLANNQVPNSEYYLRNAIVSSGVLAMMEIAFYLLGHRTTSNIAVHIIEGDSPFVSCPAKILRLWDDLGSAKDENQEGYDGSYVKCYMKDNPHCSIYAAREHIKNLIAKSWEELNREYFCNRSFSPHFTEASLNCARMVRVMYDYNEERNLPMMNDYIQTLLSGK